MTRIYFFPHPDIFIVYSIDDPRKMRELIKEINTGEMLVGEDEVRLRGNPQWAVGYSPLHIITVAFGEPPVQLSGRLYDVMFGIADGKTAGQIAHHLGITPRTVYEYTALLKARFKVGTKEEMIVRAMQIGLLTEDI